jgi:hypothetical protein
MWNKLMSKQCPLEVSDDLEFLVDIRLLDRMFPYWEINLDVIMETV